MKTIQCFILFILSLFLLYSTLNAQDYCDLIPQDNSSEWIAGVQVGSFSETSADDQGGYYFASDANIELEKGQSYDLELTPGFAGDTYDEYWRVWVDYNDDGDFNDNNELVFDAGSGSTGIVDGSFTVPTSAQNTTTRLRVAMKYVGTNDEAAPQPCGQFDYGEVEDFSVIISGNSDDPGPYCSSNGNNTSSEWIANVTIAGFTHNSGDDSGYGNHTDQGTITMEQGSNNSMTLTPGYSGDSYDEYWRIWIDFNGDNDFSDAGELVYDPGNGFPDVQSDVLEISSNANTGLTRMRVAMKGLSANDSTGPDVCGTYDYGETEDYLVNITAGSQQAPNAEFAANVTSGLAPLMVNFTDQSSNNPETYSWSFEGGSPATSSSANPTVFYNNPGIYNVTLTVTNDGGSDTETKTNYITVNSEGPEAPVAAFSSSTTSGEAPLTVNFFDQSSNNPVSWAWNFQGGSPSTSADQNPVVQYTSPGVYTVTLAATNAEGSDTETIQNYITVTEGNTGGAPQAQFVADITAGPAPLTVNFTDLSSNNPTSWSWIFEGGSPSTSSAQNPTVVYNNPGTYEVTLVASNAVGTDTETLVNYITVTQVVEGAPQAQFTSDVTEGPAPLVVNFFDQSTNNPTQRAWSFPGGAQLNSDALNPVVQYEEPGVYDVILTVSNDSGTDTETKIHYITVTEPVIAPQADFSSSIQEGGSPLTVTFFDQSTNDPTEWLWEFAGGIPGTSDEKNPTVVYQNEGTYQVSLTSSNEGGSDTEIKSGYIVVGFPASLGDNAEEQMTLLVFPNPAHGNCQLQIKGFDTKNTHLRVLAADGKQVLAQHLGAMAADTQFPLDLSNFPAGIYTVQVTTDSGIALNTRLVVL